MENISIEIGKKIRFYRKKKGLTLAEMSELTHKSISTISKYETGAIPVDVETLYDIAGAVGVHVEQLLYARPASGTMPRGHSIPIFFRNCAKYYCYAFDGRSQRITKWIIDIISTADNNGYNIMLYMDFKDYDNYRDCENTYWGIMEHFDAVTRMSFNNRDTELERGSIQVLASFMDSETLWGMWSGFSFRPMMPVASKVLLSKKALPEDQALLQKLKITRDDIRILKQYNMFAVI